MRSSARCEIIDQKGNDEQVVEAVENQWPAGFYEGDWQSSNSRRQNPDCCEQHQTFVDVWFSTEIESRANQDSENQYVAERDREKRKRIDSGNRRRTFGTYDGGDRSDDQHETGDHTAGNSETHMRSRALARDQRRLR